MTLALELDVESLLGGLTASGAITPQPINTVPPTLDNEVPESGDVVTIQHGTYNIVPTSYVYAWYANSALIGGETGQTYQVLQAEGVEIKGSEAGTKLGATGPATLTSNSAIVQASGSGLTPLAGYLFSTDADSFARVAAAAYTGSADGTAFQREAAADVLRSSHKDLNGNQSTILEDDPTACVLVAPGTPSVTPDVLKFSATYSAIPVTASLLKYQYKIDAGSWVDNPSPTATTLTDITTTAGSHTVSVRAVSTSGVFGAVATSASFDVDAPPEPTYYESLDPTGITNSDGLAADTAAYSKVVVPVGGTAVKLGFFRQYTNSNVNVLMSLYDSGGTLITSGTGTALGSDPDGSWFDADISQALSSGTYWVGLQVSHDGNQPVIYDTGHPADSVRYDFSAVFGTPRSTLPSASSSTLLYALRIGVI